MMKWISYSGSKQNLYEGDIVLTDHDDVDTRNYGDVDGPLENTVKRNAQWARKGLWLTKEVPYEIHSDLGMQWGGEGGGHFLTLYLDW